MIKLECTIVAVIQFTLFQVWIFILKKTDTCWHILHSVVLNIPQNSVCVELEWKGSSQYKSSLIWETFTQAMPKSEQGEESL